MEEGYMCDEIQMYCETFHRAVRAAHASGSALLLVTHTSVRYLATLFQLQLVSYIET